MTKAQRVERDFWLGCAERAKLRHRPYNLCARTSESALTEMYEERLALFRPAPAANFWWDYDGRLGFFNGHDYESGRVLAACFLAAMAELGE